MKVIDGQIYCFGTKSQQAIFADIRNFDATLVSHKQFTDSSGFYFAPWNSHPLIINDYIYIGGAYVDSSYFSPYSSKITKNLDTVFLRHYNFGIKTVFTNACVDYDDNIVFTGYQLDTLGVPSDDQLFITKIDTFGNVIWNSTVGGWRNDAGLSVVNTPDSGYLVSGFGTLSPSLESDPYLVKFDNSGIVQWQQYNHETVNDDGLFITKIDDGLCLRYGTIDINTLSGANTRFQVIDYDGNVFWDSVYVLSDDFDSAEDVIVDSSGFTFSGPYRSNGIYYPQIGRMDWNGNLIWHRVYGNRSSSNVIFDIESLPNGDIIGAGYLNPDPQHPSQDAWLLRLNCLGYDTLPRAKFNYQLDSTLYTTESIQFNNLSLCAENYYWEFGDGQSYQHSSNPAMLASSIPNVKHVYTMPGTYIVKLHAIACQDTTTFLDTIFVGERPKLEGFYVYPNPTQNGVYIRNSALDANSTYTLSIYSIDGRIAYSKNVSGGELINEYYLDTPGWASGVYNGVISAGDERHNFRFVIARE